MLKIFYNKNQSVDTSKMNLYSPSASKPEKTMQYWENADFPIEIISKFRKMNVDEIAFAHDKKYVETSFRH